MANRHHLYLALWTNPSNTIVKWTVVIRSTDGESNTWLDAWGAINFGTEADELLTVNQRPVEFHNTDVIVGAIDIAEITTEHYNAIVNDLGDIGVERPEVFEPSSTWDLFVWASYAFHQALIAGDIDLGPSNGVPFGGIDFRPWDGEYSGLVKQIQALFNMLLLAPQSERGMGNIIPWAGKAV